MNGKNQWKNQCGNSNHEILEVAPASSTQKNTKLMEINGKNQWKNQCLNSNHKILEVAAASSETRAGITTAAHHKDS